MNRDARTSKAANRSILSIVCFNFASYVCNGLPLAVLPGFVLKDLGFGSVMAGLLIGAQYMTTLVARPLAGNLADRLGAKRTVMTGLAGLVASGALNGAAILLHGLPCLSFSLLLVSRAIQGTCSALVSTPSCTWAIGLNGTPLAARVMSWNGIAAYGGTAFGAPMGVLVRDHAGLPSIGLCIALIGATALLLARARPAAPLVGGERLPFGDVFRGVLPDGVAMACSSAGFGSLTAFIALYFESLRWAHGAWCLTGFGLAFIFARLSSPNVVTRFGGYRVVRFCMTVQSLGLLLVWLAPSAWAVILGASLTGMGVSWVYPGLAVETLARTPPANRNSALGALSLFFDLAVGLAGPVMGLIASGLGLPSVFLCAALLSIAGTLLVTALHRQRGRVALPRVDTRPLAP